jgi:dynein heavy chain
MCILVQDQANRWIRKLEANNELVVIRPSEPGFLRTLENAVQFGRPVLLERLGEDIDPVLTPLLKREVFQHVSAFVCLLVRKAFINDCVQEGMQCIRLGENIVEYDARFRQVHFSLM